MFFVFFLTSVLNSEYLISILLRANLLLFLGPENVNMTDMSGETDGNVTQEVGDFLVNGTFYYDSSDNFENYLSELGVGYFLRKLALLAFPIITITRDCPEAELFNETECEWAIKTDAGLRSHVINFYLDTWTDDVTMDGRNIKTKFTRPSPDTLLEFQMADRVNTTLVRQFFQDKMIVRMNVNNVNASSLFTRNIA